MLDKEIKISLPIYKIIYSVFGVVILSIIRGISMTNEIGSAMEAPLAMLAAVFCADTYVQEIVSRRSEVQRLCPMKKRILSIGKRMAVQELFLFLLAAAGYGLFIVFQRPMPFYEMQEGGRGEMEAFGIYLAAIAVTLIFWGMLSHTVSCLFANAWAGIGVSLILWIMTDSSIGDRYLGSWNLFSYTFWGGDTDMSWVYGKMLCICFSIIMAALLPKIISRCRR